MMSRVLERLTGCGAGLRREKRQPQAGQGCRRRSRELIHKAASNLVPTLVQRQREVVIDLDQSWRRTNRFWQSGLEFRLQAAHTVVRPNRLKAELQTKTAPGLSAIAFRHCAIQAAVHKASAEDAGNRNVNVAPGPSWLETSSVPPCASTMTLEIASPKPARPCDVVRAASAR